MIHKQGLHVSLNLHRGPGFCINAGFNEPFNLWNDKEAQDAFYFHWGMWAERYKNISSEKLSFDLLNEPCYKEDMNDQFSKSTAVPGETYRKVAIGAVKSYLGCQSRQTDYCRWEQWRKQCHTRTD